MRVIIADTAVSLAPPSWKSNQKVKAYYQKYGRMPLVNASKHQHLLQNIPKQDRLDRPDILHFGLLTVLGYSKLITDMEIIFSTSSDYYSIDPSTRLPRSQSRFYGILEQVLSDTYQGNHIQSIPAPPFDDGNTVIFSPHGRPIQPTDYEASNFIFGGFAHGSFKTINDNKENTVSLASDELDLWTSLSLFLNQYRRHS